MRKFYSGVVRRPRAILAIFAVLTLVCLLLQRRVRVNYAMKDYLPADAPSTRALSLMQREFTGGIPNARVMIRNVTIPQALAYKENLLACPGVTDVLWLDDAADVYAPLAFMDADALDAYYKDGDALFTVTIDAARLSEGVAALRACIGEENAMSGDAVSTALATASTVTEIRKIAAFAVLFVIVVLLITTPAWFEPVVVMLGLGVAIVLNAGSNLLFGEISFVTNAAGSILQLAVSLDYSVFLMHRFEECKKSAPDPQTAMVDALCKSTVSILSSGLTTVIGFLALVFMRFRIGPDLGLALAKGITIGLITVFVFMPALILRSQAMLARTRHRPFLPDFQTAGRIVLHAMLPAVCVFALLIAPSYLASNANSFYYGSAHIFGPGTRLGADVAAIESVFGKGDAYVLLTPRGDPRAERALCDALHALPQVKSVVSYTESVGNEIPPEYLDADTLSKLVSDSWNRMVLSVEADYEGAATFACIGEIRQAAQRCYPDAYALAGEGVSACDLRDTITADMPVVNLIAIGAVFLVLAFSFRSALLPVLLVLCIETAIWINLAIPYFRGETIFYISYLIVSSVQLGATVDYAILFTDRYRECRKSMEKRQAVVETVRAVCASILTSASVMAVVGYLLGCISTHGILAQLGLFIGRGALLSLAIVLLVLPGLLYIFDRPLFSPARKCKKGGRKSHETLLA